VAVAASIAWANGAPAWSAPVRPGAGPGSFQVPVPPPVVVRVGAGHLAAGLIFVTPRLRGSHGAWLSGTEILDDQGLPVWFRPLPQGVIASDFRVQTYRGHPALTWWQGSPLGLAGPGPGVDYIANTHYQVVKTVKAGNGDMANGHEFELIPGDRALITVYKSVPANLSSVGGSAHGRVIDGIAQEIDVATGKILFQWQSVGHVPFDESYQPRPGNPKTAWDYFHINSVHLDTDGNLLISGRNTWTVYKVNIRTGAVMWSLGGKDSSFKLGAGVRFAWQHAPVALASDTLRIFDNESNGTPVLPYSRVITVRLDYKTMSASLLNWFVEPGGLSTGSQGDAETLPDGDIFVGWGAPGRFSEFTADGQQLFDAQLPQGYDSYRAYKDVWHGMPSTAPVAVVIPGPGGGSTVDAVWNGATNMASWEVLGGASPGRLVPVGVAAWDGLDTPVTLATEPVFLEVVARNAAGAEVGKSPVVASQSGLGAPARPRSSARRVNS
jgi:hypothetical protein